MTHPARLSLWRETVRPEWTDYNRHENVACCALVFDHGVDAFFDDVGPAAPIANAAPAAPSRSGPTSPATAR